MDGNAWTVETVADGATGQGLDLTVDADGNPILSYFTEENLEVAAWVPEGAQWRTASVAPAPAGLADAKGGNVTPTAGVAVDDAGTIYVTWAGDDGVALASGDGSTFTPIETGIDTGDGAYPLVATNADGSAVFVAWYDTVTKALMMGVQGDPGELGIAQPSPAPSPGSQPSTGGAECGTDGKIALDIVAQNIAFDPTCLVAPAGEAFSINFDNKDDARRSGRTTSRSRAIPATPISCSRASSISGPTAGRVHGRRARCRQLLLPLRRPPDDDGAVRRGRGQGRQEVAAATTGCHRPPPRMTG